MLPEDLKVGRFAANLEREFVEELKSFLMQPDSITRMIAASDLGKPAVEALVKPLKDKFQGREWWLEKGSQRHHDTNRLIGMIVKQAMHDAGYSHQVQGCKIGKDKIFSTGTRYELPQENNN